MSKNDPKYDFFRNMVKNVASGEYIPEDEPVMVFRARDNFALSVLRHYHSILVQSGQIDDSHLAAVEAQIGRFYNFRYDHPDRMKVPDTELPQPPRGKEE